MSTYALDIDGSGAESGAQRIVKSFDSIKAAADRMEGGVSAAARKASSAFSSMQSAAKPVSAAAIDSLRSLSAVFKGYRGPSDAAVRNTIMFLQGLRAVGAAGFGRAGGLSALLTPLAGFKGPSATAGRNTAALLSALNRVSGFRGSSGLSGTLTALGSFRGPSAAGARNTRALLAALATFTAPRGLAATTRAFIALSDAANRASGSVGRLRTLAAGNMNINVGTRGSGSIRDLAKDHGLLQSAILKTQTAMNALGSILAARSIIHASNDVIRIKAQLEAATGSVQQARVQFGYLRDTADKLGLDFVTLSQSFGFFLGSIKGTGVAVADAKRLFEGFTIAGRALQLSTSDVDGVFRALGQMMSKGKVQAEELRGQLGDRLPGAFVRFAVAMKMVKPGELDAALKAGAISGDKMKQGLLAMADTLKNEFTPSAEKMSHTVDAAFNRLKNTFTFASSALGQSGLNEGIIKITDSLRQLIESRGFSNFLQALGGAIKFVADNATILSAVLTGYAISSVTKFMIGSQLAAKAVMGLRAAFILLSQGTRVFMALQAAQAVGNLAMALGGATRATQALTRSQILLNAVMRLNPYILLATIIAGVVYWLSQATDKNEELKKAMDNVNTTTGDAANLADAFASSTMNLANKTDELTRSLIANTKAKYENAIAGSNQFDLGLKRQGRPMLSIAGHPIFVDDRESQMGTYGSAGKVSGQAMKDLQRVATQDAKGNWHLKPASNNAAGFQSQVRAQAYLRTMVQGGLYGEGTENLRPASEALDARVNAQIAQSRLPGYKGLDYAGIAEKMYPNYNKDRPDAAGISGDPIEKKKKKKKGDGGAGARARADEQDIRRALEALRDLRREVSASDAAIDSLLTGSTDVIAEQARAAARSKVDNFEDSFATVERAHQGLMKLAERMKGEKLLDPSEDISSYDKARKAVENYTSAQEELAARRKVDQGAAENIDALKKENTYRANLIPLMAKGGDALQFANREMEIEKALVGASEENHTRLADAMRRELEVRDKLIRAEETANAIREANSSAEITALMTPLIKSGTNDADLDYYREMYTERQRLIQQGYSGGELRARVDLKAATLDLNRVEKMLMDQREKLNQLSQDEADIVVDGFKKGIESGQNFLKTIKGIFNELKNVLLDFVLYNPLKDFLKQTFTSVNESTYGGSSTKMQGALGSVSTSTSTLSGFLQNIGGPTSFAPELQGVSGSNLSPAARQATQIQGAALGSEVAGAIGDILVRGQLSPKADLVANVRQPVDARPDPFANFKKVFDFKTNGKAMKDFGGALKGLTKAGGTTTKAFGEAASGALQSAGAAFAAYSVGKQLGKALGLGRVGGEVMGGAAAGFSVGGPAGAAVGAALGLGKALLFKPKRASQYATVTIGANGMAAGGAGASYGAGDAKAATTAGRQAASMFNQFALQFGGDLRAGSFGTFGAKDFKGDKTKDLISFYTTAGVNRKGKPLGREGTDWIRGTDSEVQAFALKKQIQNGNISGLSSTTKAIGMNSTAATMEELQSDFAVGEAYDNFVKGSFKLSDLSRQVVDLADAYTKLSKQARGLGLDEAKLLKARNRIANQLKSDFNFSISQGILGYENPQMQAYNAMIAEYKETVENAIAVGGDLAAVEKYYGLKRKEIAESTAQGTVSAVKSAADELLNSLTASSNSPLNAGTVLRNAQDLFHGLQQQLLAGDTTNVDKLSGYSQNYLDAAREVNGSSTSYFDIFTEVTDFLKQMSATNATTAGGTLSDIPSLPSLDSLVAEITAKNAEVVAATTDVGMAVVTTGADTVDAINNVSGILSDFLSQLTGTGQAGLGAVPSTYTGGSTGVADTGTVDRQAGGLRTVGQTAVYQ